MVLYLSVTQLQNVDNCLEELGVHVARILFLFF